jgi:hypothetical protein
VAIFNITLLTLFSPQFAIYSEGPRAEMMSGECGGRDIKPKQCSTTYGLQGKNKWGMEVPAHDACGIPWAESSHLL